jgi:flavin reductase (DIM6/NTAB) family NADH-FMN oxidoreductase RutF
VLYFGTPVVLVSTLNEDGSANLAPMSSAWWVTQPCMLGLDSTSKTTQNLAKTGECVLNLASSDLVSAVDRLALLTGTRIVPEHKRHKGFRYEPDKFGAAGLTAVPATGVGPPRVLERPIQLEGMPPVADGDEGGAGEGHDAADAAPRGRGARRAVQRRAGCCR